LEFNVPFQHKYGYIRDEHFVEVILTRVVHLAQYNMENMKYVVLSVCLYPWSAGFIHKDVLDGFSWILGGKSPWSTKQFVCSFYETFSASCYRQVVKVTWHNAASPPHMDGSVVFTMWRQCTPHT